MTVREMGSRAENMLDPFSSTDREFGNEAGQESGSWLTKRKLAEGSDTIAPQSDAAGDIWCSDDFELTLGREGSDRNDTIPSPPPELESTPFHSDF